jgi:hypothetical protein
MRIALACGTAVLAAGAIIAAQQASDTVPAVPSTVPASHVDRFLSSTESPLVSYRAIRQLEATARKGKMTASLVAVTSLDPETGFQYQILEEKGSGVIRSKVLRAALEAERKARMNGEVARGALTPANYEFSARPLDDSGLVRVDIRPLREDTMLIQGSILLTGDAADLVRIEGRLVKRPSFWTRRVDVVRRYTRIAGIRVPVSMESTAEVLLAGHSTFEMRYQYETINGTAVPSDAPASASVR